MLICANISINSPICARNFPRWTKACLTPSTHRFCCRRINRYSIGRHCRFRPNEWHIRYCYCDSSSSLTNTTDVPWSKVKVYTRAPAERRQEARRRMLQLPQKGPRYRRMLGEGWTVEGVVENANVADIEAWIVIERVDSEPQMPCKH